MHRALTELRQKDLELKFGTAACFNQKRKLPLCTGSDKLSLLQVHQRHSLVGDTRSQRKNSINSHKSAVIILTGVTILERELSVPLSLITIETPEN